MRDLLGAYLLVYGAAIFAAFPAFSTSLGPPDKVETLRSQPNQRYPFIIRFAEKNAIASAARDLRSSASDVTELELINGIAATLKVTRAFELADQPGITQVWYLHPNLAPLYVHTIEALAYNVNTLPMPNLVNLSIGPQARFWSREAYVDEPMHAATQAAAEAGLIPVIAIGNNPRAEDMPGWANPWCWPEWVICVGAYDVERKNVAGFSARGAVDRPETWPDVVADGVDVIAQFPTNLTKSPQRKQRDEANSRFRELVPRGKWDLYTMESGTSQAAGHVSAAAAQILFFLKELISRNDSREFGDKLFSLTAVPERVGAFTADKPRLTGTATPQADGSVIFEYTIDLPWKLVKQLLVDTALPVEGATLNSVGAGLVDLANVQQQFGQFGLADVKTFHSKVLD